MSLQPIQILLVEDSPIATKLMTDFILQGIGIENCVLSHTENFTKAIHFLQEKKVDVILLDLGLPESYGLETFQKMYSLFETIPIIVLTGNEDKEMALASVSEGAQDYLVKGQLNSNTLSQSIRYAIERGNIKIQQIEYQKRLKRFTSELEKLNDSKDKYFSILAHDLKAPFGGLLGLSNIIIEDFETLTKEELFKFNVELNVLLNNQFKLLQNLLEWGRLQMDKIDFNPKPFLLYPVVNEIIVVLNPAANSKGILLSNKVLPEQVIKADEYMLRSMVQNLVHNALKFSVPCGQVIVNSEIVENNLELSITDTGVGISEKEIDNIFSLDRSRTTLGTAQEKGTGLGLLLCKDMVEKHGGSITVTSAIDQGTTFMLSFPV